MDRILRELFGEGEPEAPPATATSTSASTTAEKPTDPEREARREARQQRKSDAEARRKRKEFIERYTTGDPSEGFTTDEAVAHLKEMRDEMSPGEFRRAMQRTLEHLPPDQRDAFVAMMRQHKAAHPAADKEPGAAGVAAAPAAATGTRTAPGAGTGADAFGGLMTGLMGSGAASGAGAGNVNIGDLFDDLTKRGAKSPSASPGQPTEADFEALLNSPLARAVLGGVAAYGMQQMQADEDDHDKRG
jgi:hypothetical protein